MHFKQNQRFCCLVPLLNRGSGQCRLPPAAKQLTLYKALANNIIFIDLDYNLSPKLANDRGNLLSLFQILISPCFYCIIDESSKNSCNATVSVLDQQQAASPNNKVNHTSKMQRMWQEQQGTHLDSKSLCGIRTNLMEQRGSLHTAKRAALSAKSWRWGNVIVFYARTQSRVCTEGCHGKKIALVLTHALPNQVWHSGQNLDVDFSP